VIQLTGLGKLDVTVDEERFDTLVAPDSKRNFILGNIWPSSCSIEHESKALWRKWLSSPKLEQQDIKVKLLLLADYCNTHDIDCVIVQGYDLMWSQNDRKDLSLIISDIQSNIINDYKNSQWYNTEIIQEVPVLEYQLQLAETFCTALTPEFSQRLEKIKGQYFN
jgi:hypothetical protein